ncbi:hypothetical protein ABMA27_007328 [Loxostege sticticalis]|uniref:CCHC-type domain-containing protein n=1 Tax=Loxostege sticticalis TaxID=481309 RepID=A0ABR3HFJ4_LOXSC
MSIGKIGDFDITTGNWSAYAERIEMYFLANKIAEEMKLPTLIAVMGEPAYELLATLASPAKPSTLKYQQALDLLQTHLQPKPSTLAERYRFRQRRQHVEESIANYVADLKKLTRYCEFGSQLEENMRDQFVCGLRSETIRQRLFAEENLSYNRAISLAISLEAAERDSNAVENNKPLFKDTEVNAVNVEKCFVCGKFNHQSSECRYKNYTCSLCHKIGHLRRMCSQKYESKRVDKTASSTVAQSGGWKSHRGRARPSAGGTTRGHSRRPNSSVAGNGAGTAYWVREPEGEEDSEEEEDLDEPMYQMSLTKYKPI